MKRSLASLLLMTLAGCASTPSHSPGAGNLWFHWPVKRGTLTQGFKHNRKKHQGIDIAARRNTPIYAAESGRVLYVGREFSGYGKMIIIEHKGDAWATFYAHLNSFDVSEGDWVRRGELIGRMGRTGRASGVHLHFEIRRNLKPVNPLNYLSRKSIQAGL